MPIIAANIPATSSTLMNGVDNLFEHPLDLSIAQPKSGCSAASVRKIKDLQPGARFVGIQHSEPQNASPSKYDVAVEIKNVNLEQNYLCGYLKIHGLTKDYPELTTFFDGEILTSQKSFCTNDWGATWEDDLEHWSKYDEFWELKKHWEESEDQYCDEYIYNYRRSNFVFMRWKEKFLVPDHTIEQISGATYDGFYYIGLDLATSSIRGYYYAKSSATTLQQLDLTYERHFDFPSFDFR